MRKLCLVPALLLVLLEVITSAQSQPLVLAIVRFDGHLVPFAAYDNGRWERAWPEADESVGGTPSLETTPSIWRRAGQQVPLVWQLMIGWGKTITQARVRGVGDVDSHCSAQLALTTDLPAHEPQETERLGVATDSSLPLVPIDLVDRTDAAWRAAFQVIIGRFSALESAQAKFEQKDLTRQTPPPAVDITALYRERGSPQSPIYFIAEKRYGASSSPQYPECPLRTVITGWLVPGSAGRLTMSNTAVFLTDCDTMEVIASMPLAAMRVGGRPFWVLQEYGHEREAFLIVEPSVREIRSALGVFGGGC